MLDYSSTHRAPPGVEDAGDIGNELIWVGVFWGVSCALRLALSLIPSNIHLSHDLPATADVNTGFPTSGDLEAAA